jgi:hypothetical protein
MLSDDDEVAVRVVREALENLTEFVALSAADKPEAEIVRVQREMQETLFALMAFLICLDRQYDPRERALIAQLVELEDEPNAEMNFLRRYAERWERTKNQIPQFFRNAVEADSKASTDYARGIMREIQIAANNCAVTDRHFSADEKRTIGDYLHLLEAYLEGRSGGKGAWLEP